MTSKNAPIFWLFFALSSCSAPLPTPQINPAKALEQAIQTRKVELRSEPCTEAQCARASVVYFELAGGESEALNASIAETLNREVLSDVLVERPMPPIPARANIFIQRFQAMRQTLSIDEPLQWEIESASRIFGRTAKTISVDILETGMAGGAHGYEKRRLFTFDRTSGAMLTWRDLVLPEHVSDFLTIAEQEFRLARSLDVLLPLNEQGFNFPNGEFFLKNGCIYTDDGFLFRFDAYDIGPYSMGETNFAVPMDRVREFVRPEYRVAAPVPSPLP